MDDLLLLIDPDYCPQCRRQHNLKGLGQCRNCGLMLFDRRDNYALYEKETGLREYWVFTKDNGWMHSTQLKSNQPLSRSVDSNPGSPVSHQEQVEKIKQQTKDKIRWYLKQKKTIKSFGK